MVFCRCCGEEMHETASACPHCGGVIEPPHRLPNGPLWIPITSLILGVLCILSLFDDSEWNKDAIIGVGSFSVASFILGTISFNKLQAGKGMAITGITLSSITLLALIGIFSN